MSLAERAGGRVTGGGSHSGMRVAVFLAVAIVLLSSGAVAAAASAKAAPIPTRGVAGLKGVLPRLKVGARVGNMASEPRQAEGRRVQSGRVTDITEFDNWSGLGVPGSGIEGAEGAWTVPAVEPSTAALYSSTWVGVDGLNNPDLIQTGTSQYTGGGSTSYFAWYEILPSDAVVIGLNSNPAPVEPGDQMLASVAETNTEYVWTIYLKDVTQNWYFEDNFYYYGPGDSAEWIEEAPAINGVQSTLADFGTADFSDTAVYGDFGSDGTAWYGTEMNAGNEIAMTNEAGTTIVAMPSAPSVPSSSGQSFSDTYVTAPGTPTDVVATPEVNSVHLSWQSPAADGGTPIDRYYIQVFLSGTYQETIGVTTTSTTFTGLTPGDVYSYAVAAYSFGNWTSPYSTESSPVTVKAGQTISFTSTAPSNATVGGATYTVTATATSGLAVSFTSATRSACSVSGSTVSFIRLGTCTIHANQRGNTNYAAAAQVTQSLPVGQGSQTTSFTSTAPSNATVGGATHTVTATATSGLAVSFSSATSSVCSVSGSTVRFIGAGTCTIHANQGGNANYAAAAQVSQSFPVHPATTTTTLSITTPLTYGAEGSAGFHVTVTATNLTPTGTVTIKNGSTTLCTITLASGKGSCPLSAKKLPVGAYGLVATYGGSTDFKGSTSAKETLTVAKATTKTVLKLSPTKVTYGSEQVEHLSVTVSPQYSGTTPIGKVTITESTTVLCVITLSGATGSCTLPAKKLPAGSYAFVATYGGITNFKGSTSAKETLTVAK
ncbi:MAG: G1 family glutamic endopeptidase [Acidimicrobiales bacterium]